MKILKDLMIFINFDWLQLKNKYLYYVKSIVLLPFYTIVLVVVNYILQTSFPMEVFTLIEYKQELIYYIYLILFLAVGLLIGYIIQFNDNIEMFWRKNFNNFRIYKVLFSLLLSYIFTLNISIIFTRFVLERFGFLAFLYSYVYIVFGFVIGVNFKRFPLFSGLSTIIIATLIYFNLLKINLETVTDLNNLANLCFIPTTLLLLFYFSFPCKFKTNGMNIGYRVKVYSVLSLSIKLIIRYGAALSSFCFMLIAYQALPLLGKNIDINKELIISQIPLLIIFLIIDCNYIIDMSFKHSKIFNINFALIIIQLLFMFFEYYLTSSLIYSVTLILSLTILFLFKLLYNSIFGIMCIIFLNLFSKTILQLLTTDVFNNTNQTNLFYLISIILIAINLCYQNTQRIR